jgi:hypothetical protein
MVVLTRSRILLLGLVLAATLLNAVKPLIMDHQIYYEYATHIARHPFDPYGFMLFGANPANEMLAPPDLLYWLAAAMRLFGDEPFVLKLSLLPLVALLGRPTLSWCIGVGRSVRGSLEMDLSPPAVAETPGRNQPISAIAA